MARTRTPPGGKTAAPSTRSVDMNVASFRHRSPKRPSVRRLALYSNVMWDISGSRHRLSTDGHGGHRATHRENRDRPVVPHMAAALCGRGDANEGADLEPSLAGAPIGRLVGVGQHRRFVVGWPAPQGLPIPRLVQ